MVADGSWLSGDAIKSYRAPRVRSRSVRQRPPILNKQARKRAHEWPRPSRLTAFAAQREAVRRAEHATKDERRRRADARARSAGSSATRCRSTPFVRPPRRRRRQAATSSWRRPRRVRAASLLPDDALELVRDEGGGRARAGRAPARRRRQDRRRSAQRRAQPGEGPPRVSVVAHAPAARDAVVDVAAAPADTPGVVEQYVAACADARACARRSSRCAWRNGAPSASSPRRAGPRDRADAGRRGRDARRPRRAGRRAGAARQARHPHAARSTGRSSRRPPRR